MIDVSKLTVDDEITDLVSGTHTYYLYPTDWTLAQFESEEYYTENYGKVVGMCIEKWISPSGETWLYVSPTCEEYDPFTNSTEYSDVDWYDLDPSALDDRARKYFGLTAEKGETQND